MFSDKVMNDYKKKNAASAKAMPLAIEDGKNENSKPLDRRGWVECVTSESFAAFGQWFLGMSGRPDKGQQR